MDKIKFVDALKSTTMFLVDKSIEDRLEKEIVETISMYQSKMFLCSNLVF